MGALPQLIHARLYRAFWHSFLILSPTIIFWVFWHGVFLAEFPECIKMFQVSIRSLKRNNESLRVFRMTEPASEKVHDCQCFLVKQEESLIQAMLLQCSGGHQVPIMDFLIYNQFAQKIQGVFFDCHWQSLTRVSISKNLEKKWLLFFSLARENWIFISLSILDFQDF